MNKYPGISTKIDKNNNTQIMVRFKHQGTTYPVKNFTKLFGCKTQKQAFNKLQEVKLSITNGFNPFNPKGNTLNDIFYQRIENKLLSKQWSEYTVGNYKIFYENVIKKSLGHKKLNKITYDDLCKILENKEIIVKKNVWKNRLKQILNPIFKEAIKRDEIHINPCEKIEHFSREDTETVSSKIVDGDLLSIAQKLYNAIENYPVKTASQKNEYKCFLYLVLLTAHRKGEVSELKKEDCYLSYGKIISPKEITKTKEESEFPIPRECIAHIESIESGKLFPNIKRDSIYLMFQRLVRISGIELRREKKLTIHNTRNLMLNIMIEHGVDSKLADSCLDHKMQGTIRSYIEFSFKQKKDAYQKYWDLVRNDRLSLKKEEFRKRFYKQFEKEFEIAWQKELELLD